MITSLEEFYGFWQHESASTQRLLDVLTDASLVHEAYPGGRTIGRLAWHIAQTIPEMMARTGLVVTGVDEPAPVPPLAQAIAAGYRAVAASLPEEMRTHWTDASLAQTDEMYGEEWTRAVTLAVLVAHQTHHRGQLTVLMRQANLPVTGMYGPAKEEWASMGMDPPTV